MPAMEFQRSALESEMRANDDGGFAGFASQPARGGKHEIFVEQNNFMENEWKLCMSYD